jgi:hypothetical protein
MNNPIKLVIEGDRIRILESGICVDFPHSHIGHKLKEYFETALGENLHLLKEKNSLNQN